MNPTRLHRVASPWSWSMSFAGSDLSRVCRSILGTVLKSFISHQAGSRRMH